MGVETALAASVLISTIGDGVRAVQDGKSQKKIQAQNREAKRLERVAEVRAKDQERDRAAIRNKIARGQVGDIENIQLQERGIAPTGTDLSRAILDKTDV